MCACCGNSSVYRFVSKSKVPDACDHLYDAVVALFKARALALVSQTRTLSDEDLMRFFAENWARWCKSAQMISHIFGYLERSWSRMKPGMSNAVLRFQPKAVEVWRETVFAAGLKEKLCPAIMNLIQEEREGGLIQQHLVRNCVDCLKKMSADAANPLSVYRDHFEQYFLRRSEEYYVNESANVLKNDNPLEYMNFVDKKIKEEQRRIESYLDESTKKTMMAMMDRTLLFGHAESLQGLFESSLSRNSLEDAACVYRLLKRISKIAPLFKMFETHVERYGRSQLESVREEMASNPRVFVDTVLAVYRRFSSFVSEAFQGNRDFALAMDTAFSNFVNHNSLTSGTGTANSMAAMLLAKFCDSFLKRGSQVADGDVEQLQTDVVSIFRYLPDKDVFMQFYTKLMAKRFIANSSMGEEMEVSMINKLKAVQGSEFTTKATRMVSDVSVNAAFNAELQEHFATKRIKPPFGVNVMVLCSGSWPVTAPQMSIALPAQVEKVMKDISTFYMRKHKGRKLSHSVNLSHAEVSYSTARNKYQLSVTAFQMVILMYAASHSTMTLRELSNETQIPNKLLCQQLSPVVRSHIFTCADGVDSTSWNEETQFVMNPKFAFKRMKLSLMSSSSGGSGSKKTAATPSSGAADMDHAEIEDIMRDRSIKLEAAIVRIMKSRRVLSYNALVKEVVEQVQRWFTPQIPMIKRAIESLLDQEFIRRRGKDSRTFEYIA